MSDFKKGAWSDAENYALLYQIVQQLVGDSKVTIKFDRINLPGRTTRALSERWAKIRNDVNTAGIANQGQQPNVPADRVPSAKKAIGATPSKRKSKDDVEMNDTTPTPKRRQSLAKKQIVKNKPVLKQEESRDMSVLPDTSGDDDLSSSSKSYRSYNYYE